MKEDIAYTLIRSARETISLQLREDGTILVRAPRHMSSGDIDAFVEKHRSWIKEKTARLAEMQKNRRRISDREREEGIRAAREQIPRRAAYFAEQMHVKYGRITIREQKTRWGSCSNKGNLNFNWKLVLMPEEILDYVVVHELAHLRELNHSERFWGIVAEILPDYRERRQKLREWGRKV